MPRPQEMTTPPVLANSPRFPSMLGGGSPGLQSPPTFWSAPGLCQSARRSGPITSSTSFWLVPLLINAASSGLCSLTMSLLWLLQCLCYLIDNPSTPQPACAPDGSFVQSLPCTEPPPPPPQIPLPPPEQPQHSIFCLLCRAHFRVYLCPDVQAEGLQAEAPDPRMKFWGCNPRSASSMLQCQQLASQQTLHYQVAWVLHQTPGLQACALELECTRVNITVRSGYLDN